MKIAIDINGGDKAPYEQIKASIKAIKELDVEIVFVGKKEYIETYLKETGYTQKAIEIVDAPDTIENCEAPVEAVKKKNNSSIVIAAELLKEKKVDAVVSAGSTGALLVCGLLKVGRIKGIKRPALGAMIPTKKGAKLLMDSGANTNCDELNLVQFAKMGSIYMEKVENIKNPQIALISNGEEDEKGPDTVKKANVILRKENLNFSGNIEGRDIMMGNADVMVCDGFLGNVILKSIEGTGKVFSDEIKKIFSYNLLTKIGYLLVKKRVKSFKKLVDYREYGGAPLLGVDGVMIKAHGSSDEKAWFNAIKQAYRAVENNVVENIKNNI